MVERCPEMIESWQAHLDLVQCILEAGHAGEHAETVDECTWIVDVDGFGAHCILAQGHVGPHAVGLSLDDPEICGETERGTGRVCLRMPHAKWSNAHDFGPDANDMRVVPQWWIDEGRDPMNWPGGPVGSIPDKPTWFFSGARPADDVESESNRQDVEEVKRRRHHGGGVGYGKGEAGEVATVAEMRGALDQAKEFLNGSINSAKSNENEIIDRAIGNLSAQKEALRQAHDALHACANADGGDYQAITFTAYAARDGAWLAKNSIGSVMEGSGTEALPAAFAAASVSGDQHDGSIAAMESLAYHFERTLALLHEATERIDTQIASLQAIKSSSNADGIASALAAHEHIDTYLATL